MVHREESVPSDGDRSTANSSFLYRFLQHPGRRHPLDGYACICLIFTFLGNLLCLKKMERRTRVAVLWVWLIAICLTAALVLRFGKYADQSITASSHDMRTVDNISTVFCEKVTVTSSIDIDVYLFPTYPAISNKLQRYDTTKKAFIAVNKYEYWGFYLIKGSKVRVMSCISGNTSFTSYMDLYIFQGKDKRKQWESDTNCNTCYKYYINIYSKCFVSYPNTNLIDIAESDEYYFLFSNQDYSGLTLQVTFTIDRAMYNTASAINKCLRTTSCTFDLVYQSTMMAVFYFEGAYQRDVTVTYICEARPWLYISAFFLIPVFFGVCASLTLIYCCRKERRNDRSSHRQCIWSTSHSFNTRREGQINQMFIEPPPSYDDVISGRV